MNGYVPFLWNCLKKKTTIFGVGIFFSVIVFSAVVQPAPYSAVITELKTGSILAQSHALKPVYPASLTKLMTLYLMFQALEQGKIHMNTPFRVSAFAAKQPPSKWGLKAGSTFSVRECILALCVKSCNDVAHVVSENLGQSTLSFVKQMNATALKLGMLNTTFRNPSGWHDPLQSTTAHDMAILMRSICLHFPQYCGFLGTRSIAKGNRAIRNTNKLLGRVPGLYLGKTGYTSPSGFNLVTATNRNNRRIISIIMGMPSKIQRDHLMEHLIETCYKDPNQLHVAIARPLNSLWKPKTMMDSPRRYKRFCQKAGYRKKSYGIGSVMPINKEKKKRNSIKKWAKTKWEKNPAALGGITKKKRLKSSLPPSTIPYRSLSPSSKVLKKQSKKALRKTTPYRSLSPSSRLLKKQSKKALRKPLNALRKPLNKSRAAPSKTRKKQSLVKRIRTSKKRAA